MESEEIITFSDPNDCVRLLLKSYKHYVCFIVKF